MPVALSRRCRKMRSPESLSISVGSVSLLFIECLRDVLDFDALNFGTAMYSIKL